MSDPGSAFTKYRDVTTDPRSDDDLENEETTPFKSLASHFEMLSMQGETSSVADTTEVKEETPSVDPLAIDSPLPVTSPDKLDSLHELVQKMSESLNRAQARIEEKMNTFQRESANHFASLVASHQESIRSINAKLEVVSSDITNVRAEIHHETKKVQNDFEARLETMSRAKTAEINVCRMEISNVRAEVAADVKYDITQLKEVIPRVEGEVARLNGRIDELTTVRTVPPTDAVTPFPVTKPVFRERSSEHPLAFIRDLEDYFNFTNTPPQHQARLAIYLLEGKAKMWSDSLHPIPPTYAEFKEKFLENYWDYDTRYSYKMKVTTGKYHRPSHGTMKDYLTRKIALARLSGFDVNEPDFLTALIKQFPIHIQDLIRSAGPVSIERLRQLLGWYDHSAESSPDRPEPKPSVNHIREIPPSQRRNLSRRDNHDSFNTAFHERGIQNHVFFNPPPSNSPPSSNSQPSPARESADSRPHGQENRPIPPLLTAPYSSPPPLFPFPPRYPTRHDNARRFPSSLNEVGSEPSIPGNRTERREVMTSDGSYLTKS
jgi:hypothetical protein